MAGLSVIYGGAIGHLLAELSVVYGGAISPLGQYYQLFRVGVSVI